MGRGMWSDDGEPCPCPHPPLADDHGARVEAVLEAAVQVVARVRVQLGERVQPARSVSAQGGPPRAVQVVCGGQQRAADGAQAPLARRRAHGAWDGGVGVFFLPYDQTSVRLTA